MRGKRAKLIRKKVYEDKSFRERSYYLIEKLGIVIADEFRRAYKKEKKIRCKKIS